MNQEPTPIAYTGLATGTPVQASDGIRHRHRGDGAGLDLDVFDGIVVQTEQGSRFVDADAVEIITTAYVRCRITVEEARALPEPDAAPTCTASTLMPTSETPWGSVCGACSAVVSGSAANSGDRRTTRG